MPFRRQVPPALAAVALTLAAVPVDALSVADLVELSRANVGDAVLVELIELDRRQPPPSATDILTLQAAGVSETVMIAFVRNARRAETPAVSPHTPADVERGDATPNVAAASRVVSPPGAVTGPMWSAPFWVPIPVVVPGTVVESRAAGMSRAAPTLDQQPGFGRFMNDGWRPGPAPSVWDIGKWPDPPGAQVRRR